MLRTLLIFTDGYKIRISEYATMQDAQKAMQDEYNTYHSDDNGEDFEEMSYCDTYDAVLYDDGNDVFLWKIYAVK